jgi:integrase
VLGGDPLQEKQEKRSVPTYASLAEQHIAHAKTYQRSWWSTEGLIRKHLLPRWGRLRLDEIHSQDIAKWLAEKSEGLKPASVEKLRCLLGKGFQLALEWEMPGVDRNPVRSVPRPVFDNRRERFLSAEEAGRLLEAAGASLNPQLKPIIHLLLYTGARISELLHAEWRHVDVDRQSWLIPMSKNGRSRRVPLSRAALDVIEKLPRFDGCPYLVPNPETRRPFVTIKHAFRSATKKAGLHGFRPHDCRHSAASFYLAGGIDLYTVSKILGHAQISSTARYAHCRSEHLLAAVEAGAAKMTRGASPQT